MWFTGSGEGETEESYGCHSQRWKFQCEKCDKCGLLAVKKEKLKYHMEAVRMNGGFSVTNVVSQQHKGTSLRVIRKMSQKELGFLWRVFKSVEVFFVVIGLCV